MRGPLHFIQNGQLAQGTGLARCLVIAAANVIRTELLTRGAVVEGVIEVRAIAVGIEAVVIARWTHESVRAPALRIAEGLTARVVANV